MLWQETEFSYSDGHRSAYRVYAGRVDLTDDDIVLGEGRAIVFVDPAETAALDKAESCAHFLPLFLASDTYRKLRDEGTRDDQHDEPRTPQLRRIEVPEMGAEDVVIDADGNAWTGTEDGSIFRVTPAARCDAWVTPAAARSGWSCSAEGRLLVADAYQGLLAMSTTTGAVERLVTEVDGQRLLLCNNAAVASNGDIWFSDSSTVYRMDQWRADFVEHTGPVGCCVGERTVPSRSISMAWPSRTA